MMEQDRTPRKRPRDRRRKSARRVQRKRGHFLCFRAREIWDEGVTYGDHTYTECHIVAYAHQFTLTLRASDLAVPKVGLSGFWDRNSFSPRSLSEGEVKSRVETLMERAREGSLSCLEEQEFTDCLY